MARHLRRKYPGAKYHVTNRGNGRQQIFFNSGDYERFVEQMTLALEKDEVILYAYCLMPNHAHIFVETPRANIDQFMGRLTTAYAMYFRYKHDRPGHCFQGRYKAPLVEGDDYILRLIRYIHLNPIKTERTRQWSREKKWACLQGFRWSSLRGYLSGKHQEEIIDYRWLTALEPRGGWAARASYRRYVRGCIENDDSVLREAFEASVYAIGDEPFIKEVDEWVKQEAMRRAAESDLVLPTMAGIGQKRIEKAVAKEFHLPIEDIKQAYRHAGTARSMLIELACSLGRMTQREMARNLGGVSEHAIGKHRQRLREKMKADPGLRRRLIKLKAQLSSV